MEVKKRKPQTPSTDTNDTPVEPLVVSRPDGKLIIRPKVLKLKSPPPMETPPPSVRDVDTTGPSISVVTVEETSSPPPLTMVSRYGQ